MHQTSLQTLNLRDAPDVFTLPLAEGCNEILVPEALSQALLICIKSLLFPKEVAPEVLEPLVRDKFECSLTLRLSPQHLVRLVRGVAAESIALQTWVEQDKAFRPQVKGIGPVSAAIERALGLKDKKLFDCIHLGLVANGGATPAAAPKQLPEERDTDDNEAENPAMIILSNAPPEAPDEVEDTGPVPSDEDIARLKDALNKAQQVEAIDDQVNLLRARIAELAKEAGRSVAHDPRLARLREELALIPESDATDEEWTVLAAPEERLREMERRRTNLEGRLTALKADAPHPHRAWGNPIFVLGTVLFIMCTTASMVGSQSMRLIALGNVVCLAGSLMGVLQFLRLRDEDMRQKRRQHAVQEALNGVSAERSTFERQLASAKRRHRVDSADELRAREQRRVELQRVERELLANMGHSIESAQEQARREEKAQIERQIQALWGHREALGDVPVPSFNLREDLAHAERRRAAADKPPADKAKANNGKDDKAKAAVETSGVRPKAPSLPPIPSAARSTKSSSPVIAVLADNGVEPQRDLRLLVDVARGLGFFKDDRLDDEVAKMWGNLLSLLLARKLSDPQLGATGQIRLDDFDPGSHWNETELALADESLRLAMILRAVGRVQPSPPPMLWRANPFQGLDGEPAILLQRLYGRLGKHLQIIVLAPDRGRPVV